MPPRHLQIVSECGKVNMGLQGTGHEKNEGYCGTDGLRAIAQSRLSVGLPTIERLLACMGYEFFQGARHTENAFALFAEPPIIAALESPQLNRIAAATVFDCN